MPGPVWGEDSPDDEHIIAANVVMVLRQVVAAASSRVAPSLELAHEWHRAIFRGVSSVPRPSYLGQPRGCDDPDLRRYKVVLLDPVSGRAVAGGVPPALAGDALSRFETALIQACSTLDSVIPINAKPTTQAELMAVVQLAALAHGEWVRIHPYTNGNGRTARVWANWVATRYGLPPFVRIKPRPDGLLYGQAAAASMGTPPTWQGDHRLTVSLFVDLLRQLP